jgi:hypothetical protein
MLTAAVVASSFGRPTGGDGDGSGEADESSAAIEAAVQTMVAGLLNDSEEAPRIFLYSEVELASNSRDQKFRGKDLLQKYYADESLFRETSIYTIPRYKPEFVYTDSNSRLARPQKEMFVHGGRSLIIFDPEREEFKQQAALVEIEHVHCDDPNCNGVCKPTGKFCTHRVPKVIKSTQGDGVATSRMYICSCCNRQVPSLNANNLKQYPPPLIRHEFKRVIDPEMYDDVSGITLSADLAELSHTLVARGSTLDTTTEYYNKSMIKDKVERMQDWWYYTAAYRSGLARLVGDDIWGILANEQKAGLIGDRAEYLAFVRDSPAEDITADVFSDAMFGDAEAVKIALELVVDSNRSTYRKYMDSFGSDGTVTSVGLDWTKISADHLGEGEDEKWLLTGVDDRQKLLFAIFTKDTSLGTAKPHLLQLKANGCHPKLVVLDNMPSTVDRDTGMVQFLKEEIWPETLKEVIQDRFHIVQKFCADLTCKQETDYHADITMCLRRSPRRMNPEKLQQVWGKLAAGAINKTTFLNGVWYKTGNRRMSDSEIKQWVDLGVVHAMFCSGANSVVPYESLPQEVMAAKLTEWSETVIMPKYFNRGKQIKVGGKYRLGNFSALEDWQKKVRLLILRCAKAIVPLSTGLMEWKETLRVDTATKMTIIQQLFNTSGNESWHSRLEALGGHGQASRNLKHTEGILGIVRLTRRKEDDLRSSGQSNGQPVLYDRFTCSFLANQYAESAGSDARLPTPHFDFDGPMTSEAPMFLRVMDQPMVSAGTASRERVTGNDPFKAAAKPRMPTGSTLQGRRTPFSGPRTNKRPLPIQGFFAPQKRPRVQQSTAGNTDEVDRGNSAVGGGSSAMDGGSSAVGDGNSAAPPQYDAARKLAQRARNYYTKWNHWPCTCFKWKTRQRGTWVCTQVCERRIRHVAMQKSGCCEANEQRYAPPAPSHGELVQFQSTAKPSEGFLYAVAPTTPANSWRPIGLRCQECKGFGRQEQMTDCYQSRKLYVDNIHFATRKVSTNKKKWGATQLKDITLCKCDDEAISQLGLDLDAAF